MGRKADEIFHAVAPPGQSNHETGRAVDFAPARPEFSRTREYAWLKRNAESFGFIETYSWKNDRNMVWEPWHFDFMLNSP